MTLNEAIIARHSVRKYEETPLPDNVIKNLEQKINEVNMKGGLHIQLITNEPKGFNSILNYGTFSGVNNYFVIAGQKAVDLDERAGYYGELLVLFAQQLGLNTCWAELTYQKVAGTYSLNEGKKLSATLPLEMVWPKAQRESIRRLRKSAMLVISHRNGSTRVSRQPSSLLPPSINKSFTLNI